MWCHAVLHVENPISSRANINLHVMRHGHWISPHGIVYMTRDLVVEDNPREGLLTLQANGFNYLYCDIMYCDKLSTNYCENKILIIARA